MDKEHPALRERIQDLYGNMGLPPPVLGLIPTLPFKEPPVRNGKASFVSQVPPCSLPASSSHLPCCSPASSALGLFPARSSLERIDLFPVRCCWIFFCSSPTTEHQNIVGCFILFILLAFFWKGDSSLFPNKSHTESYFVF